MPTTTCPPGCTCGRHTATIWPSGRWERMRARAPAKFWARVDQSAGLDGCWPWMGCKSPMGYGRVGFDRRYQFAHRVAFILSTGADPGDLVICHSCDNPPCCNPAHLWLGTHRDNAIDKVAKGRWNGNRQGNGYQHRTHCKHGHEFTPENTTRVWNGHSYSRQCRECGKRRSLEFKERHKNQAAA